MKRIESIRLNVRTDRRQFLLQGAAASSALAFGRLGYAQGARSGRIFSRPTRKAIEKGLAYLASQQQANGSFGPTGHRANLAVCSLAGMAFMANGDTPGRGKHGGAVTRFVNHIKNHAQTSGFLTANGTESHGPMYEHGFATMFLAEAYGMAMDEQVRPLLAKAVQLILGTQNAEGGWRYQPQRQTADVSVTICQVMALRAARNAGIFVPREAIQRAATFVKRCQNPDGGFSYMLNESESEFPRSAAALVALASAGIYSGPEVQSGLQYLKQFQPTPATEHEEHFFYGHYYAVQAMWHAGGDYWRNWYPAVRDVLINWQLDDGSWADTICPEYGTAMACLILQMPNNYLPIFQK